MLRTLAHLEAGAARDAREAQPEPLLADAPWAAGRVAALLARSPPEDVPALLGLLAAFPGAEAAAAAARCWQDGVAPRACARLLQRFLATAPAEAIGEAGREVIAALEVAALPGAAGDEAGALQVATLALWRSDAPSLCGAARASARVHSHVERHLGSKASGLEEMAWLAWALLLVPAEASTAAESAEPAVPLVAFGTWHGGLQHPRSPMRAAATLALAALCLSPAAARTAMSAGDLTALAAACTANVASDCARLRDSSCLALVALLTAPALPLLPRVRFLQEDASQRAALAAALPDAAAHEGADGHPLEPRVQRH